MLPEIQQIRVFRYDLPFCQPVCFNLGGKLQHAQSRQGLILAARTPDDKFYLSEIAPLPGFSKESLSHCQTQLLQLKLINLFNSTENLFPSVRYGVETLQYQLQHTIDTEVLAKCSATDVCQLYHNPSITGETIPPTSTSVKVKIGRAPIEQEKAQIQKLIRQISAKQRLRLDANQSWTLEEAISFFDQLNLSKIECVEEPLRNFSDYSALQQRFPVPIALDESLRDDTYQRQTLLNTIGLTHLVIKPMLIGLQSSLSWIEHAKHSQLKVILSSSFESNISLYFYHYLAHQLKLTQAQGLDTLKAMAGSILFSNTNIEHTSKEIFDLERHNSIHEVGKLCR
ncbi:o-succinylbenzoate synthase [Teredinibacter sp. KSP-S5-2]|uniref:o-succinylbenzoate synthase n=1 Tax=Teredinibacter sp. KSP-S5-2 TaxID=3034506 RepID=UPI0029350AFE|nr:o-succinylbenzoate synthase [Teredinibacter sp. KSP-S5-2]WNO09381.1 o-succinylbenzoate synthase [Teredinibacter sp. KSP-S5-2]